MVSDILNRERSESNGNRDSQWNEHIAARDCVRLLESADLSAAAHTAT